ncbi:MAG: PAS domain S-box protein, partial [Ferruginibacter sp.]
MTNEYLKAILDNSPQSIVLIGKNHEVLVFNKSIKDVLFEFFKREIKEGDAYYPDFVIEPNRKFYLEAFESATSGIPFQVQLHNLVEGNSRWFDYKMLPVYDGQHELLGVTLSAEDITLQKEATLKISGLSEKVKAILDNTDEAIILLDLNYKILTLNKVAANTIQHNTNLDSFEGRDYREFVPDKNDKFYEFYPLALKGESTFVKLFYQNVLGEKLWYQTKFNPVYDHHEKQIGVSIFAKDITDQKKLENDLSHVFNTISDIICVLDLEGKILRMNKSGCELLGQSQDDLLFHAIEDFIIPQDKNIFSNALIDLDEESPTFKLENRCIAKSGEIVWLSWTCNSSLAEGLIYATAKNITEEKKLRELNHQAGSMAKIGSWELDIVNNKLFWSDEVHHLHETDPKSFVPILDKGINFYREDFRQQVQSSIGNTISTGDPFDFEAVVVTAKKKELWVRVIGNAEFANGECKRIYGSFQDIHDRKEAEIRLHSLANNLPGVVFQYLIYPDGKDALQCVTKGARQIWGFEAEEINENNQLVWEQIIAGGEIEIVTKSIAESVASKTKWTARWKYVMPNGEIKTHLGYGSPSFLVDGTILFHSVILDVTQEARNEILLEEVTKLARMGSWEVDMAENKIKFSAMMHNILETDPKQDIPDLESLISFYREDFRSMAQSRLTDCFEKGISVDYEAVIVTASKNEKWVRVIGRAEMIDGKPNRIFGSLQDITERTKSALELEKNLKSLEDYKFSLDQSAIIAFTDEKGVITSVNDNFCDISKYNREELVGKTHQLINSKHHPAGFFNDLWKTIASGKVWRGEVKNKAKDGSYYWVYTTIVPFLDEKNKPFQYLAIRFDITSRKNSEIELAESENRLRTILEAEPECIKLIAPGGKLIMMNPAGLAMIEADKEEQVIGKTMLEILLPEHRAAFSNLTKNIFKGASGKLVFEIAGLKGTRRWLETHAVPMKNEQGDIIALLAVTRDITEHKKAEEDIRDSEEKRRLIMNGALDAIICIDIYEKITFWNPQAEVIFGWNEAEVMGHSLSELIVPEPFRKYHNEGIKHYLETGEGKALNILLELTAIKRSGDEFPIELTVIPIKQGEEVFFCAFIRDITQRKKTEDLLDKSNTLARIGNWEADLEKSTVYWSLVTREIHEADSDYNPDLSKDLEFYKEGENRNKIIQCVHDCIHHGATWDEELQIVTLKGNLKWVRSIGRGEFRDGKCIRVYGSFQDITERKKSETLLQESENKFRSLIENSADMLTLINEAGKMVYISPSVERTVGYTNEENKTLQIKDVMHPDDLSMAMQTLENVFKNPGVPIPSTVRNRKKDGTYIWVEGTLTNMLQVSGVNAIVANVRDVTESKKAEEKILLINERLQLATNAANVGIWDL